MITIQDPVSGVSYFLDPQRKVATKLPAFPTGKDVMVTRGPGGGGGAAAAAGPNVVVTEGAGAGPTTATTNSGSMGTFFTRTEGAPAVFALNAGSRDQESPLEGKSEALGKETIAGLPADGTRTTATIPANTIGNERPLDIVRETWYSPDLQIVLRSTVSDPRFGETTYEVSRVDRKEPSPSLFTVPSDYKVKEGDVHVVVDGNTESR
jgi:hypothetical protein